MTMLKIKVLLCLMILSLAAVFAAEVNLLQASPSVSKACLGRGIYSLAEMLISQQGGFALQLPADAPVANRMMLAAGTIKPLHRYFLETEILLPNQKRLDMEIRFQNDDEEGDLHHLMGIITASNFLRIGKEIFTPPGVANFELTATISTKDHRPGDKIGYVRSMTMRDAGAIERNPALTEYYGKNILPFGDFKNFPVGERDLAKLQIMPFSQKPYTAEVAEAGNEKFLRVKFSPGDYNCLPWFSKELPLYGSVCTMRFKVRGQGKKVKMMLWYGRTGLHTIFRHYSLIDLTPEWKEYCVKVFCDDPGTTRMAACLVFMDRQDPTTLEIAEIALVPVDPEQKQGK